MHTSKEISDRLEELGFNADHYIIKGNGDKIWKAYLIDTLLEWLRDNKISFSLVNYPKEGITMLIFESDSCIIGAEFDAIPYKTNWPDCLGEAIIKILEHEAKDDSQ